MGKAGGAEERHRDIPGLSVCVWSVLGASEPRLASAPIPIQWCLGKLGSPFEAKLLADWGAKGEESRRDSS